MLEQQIQMREQKIEEAASQILEENLEAFQELAR